MAKMWPRELPAEVLNDPLRAAERKVYRKLSEELDDSWTVFYSRPWLGLKANGEELEGECDFVVARADSGFLSIEVKGGAISHDPASDAWISKDRWGLRHRIKDPIAQASKSKHQLLKKLKGCGAWAPRRVRAKHAVILPDSLRPSTDLGIHAPLSLFCFLRQFKSGFREWLEDRLGKPNSDEAEEALGQDGIRALEELLAKPFALRTPLGHLISDDEQTFRTLTPAQYRILTTLEQVPRAAIAGGAGTGKTLLAAEKARRCAAEGMRTLLTCYNKPLADHLAEVMEPHNVEVMTFHALCRRFALLAGVSLPDSRGGTEAMDEEWPEVLIQATERRADLRFDAVIVDEGQDFRPHWWVALESVLNSGQSALLYVFFDANQRVYHDASGLPKDIGLIPVRLPENLRNTKRIHDATIRHYKGPSMEAVGPEGVDVEWREASPGRLKEVLDLSVSRCVGNEDIAPEDIAVLFAREQELEAVFARGRIGGRLAARYGPLQKGTITVETVRRFKGLERPVVIVVADSHMVRDPEMPYVALSRARSHLVVVGTRACLDSLRAADSGR